MRRSTPKKQRFGKDDIAEVFDGASKVIVAKGKKVQTISLRGMDAAEVTEALEGVVIGPTGNLRAPTIRRGKTFLVGFHEDEYSSALT